jgi:RNA polymerase sigma factor (sigma-70 family)
VLKLTEDHVTRALKIAHWYGRRARRAEISDLESAALEGLAKAAHDFDPTRRRNGAGRRSFWTFAFKRIVGEMKDELRRFDHLTREQRALVTKNDKGELFLENGASWINPQDPLPLDATIAVDGVGEASSIVDTIEEPRNPIEDFELRDALCRASEALPERHRLVFLKRELEGYSNAELAAAFEVTEGRASQLQGAAVERMRKEIGDSFVDAA